jgi:excisionase family DNA binding protein
MQDATLPELLTVKQAAEYLQVTTMTVYRWLNANLLEYIRIGKEYRIVRNSLSKSPVKKKKK